MTYFTHLAISSGRLSPTLMTRVLVMLSTLEPPMILALVKLRLGDQILL